MDMFRLLRFVGSTDLNFIVFLPCPCSVICFHNKKDLEEFFLGGPCILSCFNNNNTNNNSDSDNNNSFIVSLAQNSLMYNQTRFTNEG